MKKLFTWMIRLTILGYIFTGLIAVSVLTGCVSFEEYSKRLECQASDSVMCSGWS